MRVNLVAFARDVAGYGSSSWPPSQRLKALALLLVHRWNRYSKASWKPVLHLTVRQEQRLLNLSMRMDTDDFFAFHEIFAERYYEADLGRPDTILDLGANCGYATLSFAARYPSARIACVEPHPANLSALRENLRLNDVQATVIAGAATRDDGPTRLFVSTSLEHRLIPWGPDHPNVAIPVSGLTVPTMMSQLGWSRIDVLKIDIEGYESALFADRPAWLSLVGRIIGEVHPGYGLDALCADLCPLGFRVSALASPRMFLAVRHDAEPA